MSFQVNKHMLNLRIKKPTNPQFDEWIRKHRKTWKKQALMAAILI